VAVLIPRIRTLGVRLSEEEYSSLERFCVKSKARSISDLARAAICSFMSDGKLEHALTSTVNENAAQVKELQQRIEILTKEIALLKTNAAGREGDRSTEVNDEACSPAPESLSDKATANPDM